MYIYSNVKRRRSFVLLIATYPSPDCKLQFISMQFFKFSSIRFNSVLISQQVSSYEGLYSKGGKKETKQNITPLEQEHHWSDRDLWATSWGHWGGRPPLCFMILNLYWLLFYYFICYPSAFWMIEKNNGKDCCLYRNIMQFVLLGASSGNILIIQSVYSPAYSFSILFFSSFSFFYKVFALLSFILKTFPDMVLE